MVQGYVTQQVVQANVTQHAAESFQSLPPEFWPRSHFYRLSCLLNMKATPNDVPLILLQLLLLMFTTPAPLQIIYIPPYIICFVPLLIHFQISSQFSQIDVEHGLDFTHKSDWKQLCLHKLLDSTQYLFIFVYINGNFTQYVVTNICSAAHMHMVESHGWFCHFGMCTCVKDKIRNIKWFACVKHL